MKFTTIAIVLPSIASGFVIGESSHSIARKWKTDPEFSGAARIKVKIPPFAKSTNDGDPVSDGGCANSSVTKSSARAGGRKPRADGNKIIDTDTTAGIRALIRRWAIPWMVIAVGLRFIMGGLVSPPGGGTDYVYYSRSVHQTITYSSDGNVETRRKETFQSNIPGLVEKSTEGIRGDADLGRL